MGGPARRFRDRRRGAGDRVQPGATDYIYSISNATSKIAGPHTLRFGFQAEHRRFCS